MKTLAIVILGIIAIWILISLIGSYIDASRQDEVQEAWDIYSSEMDVDNKLVNVISFALDYQAKKGWKCTYYPYIDFEYKGDIRQ